MFTKKISFMFLTVLAVTAFTVPALSLSDPMRIHGTLKAGVEAGCWILVSDDGQELDLKGDVVSEIPKEEGLSLSVNGWFRPGWVSICMEVAIFKYHLAFNFCKVSQMLWNSN